MSGGQFGAKFRTRVPPWSDLCYVLPGNLLVDFNGSLPLHFQNNDTGEKVVFESKCKQLTLHTHLNVLLVQVIECH